MPRPETHLFFESETGIPYRGGLAFGNTCLQRSLEQSGFSTRVFVTETRSERKQSIPLEQAALRASVRAAKTAALRVFSDNALASIRPNRADGGKNVIFFRGLKYNAGAFLETSAIDGCCANSEYLKSVLLSILLYPCGKGLAPEIDGEVVVGSVPPTASCTEHPSGFPTDEPSHRRELRALLAGGRKTWFGHAIRPGKANAFASLAILAHLRNAVRARGRGDVKLFVYENDYGRFRRAALELPTRLDVDDVIVPVPFLSNEDLYWLMRRCRFSLCYDDYPEPFGVYPLDAVFNGTPVYTNGAGNLRYLLPAGHGIRTHETADMWIGPADRRFAAFKPVASAIFGEMAEEISGSKLRLWRRAIQKRYSFGSFHAALTRLIEHTRRPRALPRLKLSTLRLNLGPLVRSWSQRDGRVVSDYTHLTLSGTQNRALAAALGCSIAALRAQPSPVRETLAYLFRVGVVTWSAPFGPHVRLAGKAGS